MNWNKNSDALETPKNTTIFRIQNFTIMHNF